jgi:hypothetical protein
VPVENALKRPGNAGSNGSSPGGVGSFGGGRVVGNGGMMRTRRDCISLMGPRLGSKGRFRSTSMSPVSVSLTDRLKRVVGLLVWSSIRASNFVDHSPGLAASRCTVPVPEPTSNRPAFARVPPPERCAARTISASRPPFRKNCWTAKLIVLLSQSPPKARVNSAKLWTSVGVFTGPRLAKPTNAVIEVATPVIGWTPLGTSSI